MYKNRHILCNIIPLFIQIFDIKQTAVFNIYDI